MSKLLDEEIKIGIYNIEKLQIEEMIRIFNESYNKKIEYASNLCVDPSKNLNIHVQNLCQGTEYECSISDKCKEGFVLIGGYHTHVSEDGEDIPSILDLKSMVENGLSVECIGAKNKIRCYTRKDMSVKLPMFLVRLDIEVRRAYDKLIHIDRRRPEDFTKEHINIVRDILKKHFVDNLLYSKKELKLLGEDIFDITTTGMSFYNSMLHKEHIAGNRDPVEYFKTNKGLVFEIVYMPPQKYLEESHKIHKKFSSDYGISQIPFETYLKTIIDPDLINEYTERTLEGSKMPMPVLDYDKLTQEGRHRAVVAMELGVEEIPVLIVKTYEE